MKTNCIKSSCRNTSLAFAVFWLAAAAQGFGAEPVGSVRAVLTTNYVVVTNIVIVTNSVVVTNGTLTSTRPAPATSGSTLPQLSWVPPKDNFDWIQLKSGEWLKGRIKAMQERELDFESKSWTT